MKNNTANSEINIKYHDKKQSTHNEVSAHNFHDKHKDEGYGYRADCPVCKGTI